MALNFIVLLLIMQNILQFAELDPLVMFNPASNVQFKNG